MRHTLKNTMRFSIGIALMVALAMPSFSATLNQYEREANIMANNLVQSAHMQVSDYVNGTGSDIASGDIVVVGQTEDAYLAVALVDIANGATGSVGSNCTVTAAKVSAAVFKEGESLTWDLNVAAFDDNQATPASGDVSGAASRAEVDGADAELTCTVHLTGIPSLLTA